MCIKYQYYKILSILQFKKLIIIFFVDFKYEKQKQDSNVPYLGY